MQQDDQQQRQALIEGFINMGDMDALREDLDERIFSRASRGGMGGGPGGPGGKGNDYVEMDDDFLTSQESGRLMAGELKENTNIFKSAFHIFKANVGTGVFMIPTFYKDAGYVVSVVLALTIGSIVVDCTHNLLRSKLTVNRRDVTTYSQLCRFVMGPALGWFLFTALCMTQFGFCLMYSQLFAATMDQLVSFKNSQYLWVTFILVVGFPMTCFSDNLSLLSIASIIATVGVFYALICCIAECCVVIARNGGRPHPSCTPAGGDIPIGWFNNLANNMMVLEGIAIILPVHAACTQKRLVPTMITIVLCSVISVYLIIGMTGYIAYGNSITVSLVNRMRMDAWGVSIRVLFVINIVFTYPLQFMSAQQLLDQLVKCKPRSWTGLGIRLLVNLIIWALAMALGADTVDIVVAFIGALPSTWMVIIIPSILACQVDYAVAHPDEDRTTAHYWKVLALGAGGRWSWLRIRCCIYVVIAFLIMVIGTYSIVVFQILKQSNSAYRPDVPTNHSSSSFADSSEAHMASYPN